MHNEKQIVKILSKPKIGPAIKYLSNLYEF